MKRYYWIKLKTDFFNQEHIDFLLSQENGCQYVVLYQMLCLNTANTGGRLASNVNEVMVPYDVKKIVRDCKYFDVDTVIIALELFKKLGLIYEEENHILKLSNYEEMVGSESANSNAQRQKRFRERQKLKELGVTNSNGSNVTESVTNSNVEYRDKSIDNRYIYKKENNNISKDILLKERNVTFIKPTLEEVKKYCEERKNNVDAEKFIDFYESKGWMIGKNKMKDWKACVRTWESKDKKNDRKEELPDWFGKDIQPTTVTEEEKEEFENLLKSFSE